MSGMAKGVGVESVCVCVCVCVREGGRFKEIGGKGRARVGM